MRLVIDTNVFVSAALKEGSTPALAVELAVRNATLLKSAATEFQLLQVVARPQIAALMDGAAVERIRRAISAAEPVAISVNIELCRDATDDKFLELAVSGGADALVSGDADLLVMHPFRGIPIVSPADFLRGGWHR